MKPEVSGAKVPIRDKDKIGGLKGCNLHKDAGARMDNLSEDPNLLSGTEEGFQEVTSKKPRKKRIQSKVKKMKLKHHNHIKSVPCLRQSLPRLAKQRKSIAKSTTIYTTARVSEVGVSTSSSCSVKDASSTSISVNNWNIPLANYIHSEIVAAESIAVRSPRLTGLSFPIPPHAHIIFNAYRQSFFSLFQQNDQAASIASSERSMNCSQIIGSASGGVWIGPSILLYALENYEYQCLQFIENPAGRIEKLAFIHYVPSSLEAGVDPLANYPISREKFLKNLEIEKEIEAQLQVIETNLTLKQLSSFKIALTLWNSSDIVCILENYQFTLDYALELFEALVLKVNKKINMIPVPNLLLEDLKNNIKLIGFQIIKWKRKHFWFKTPVVSKLSWTNLGILNYEDTLFKLRCMNLVDDLETYKSYKVCSSLPTLKFQASQQQQVPDFAGNGSPGESN